MWTEAWSFRRFPLVETLIRPSRDSRAMSPQTYQTAENPRSSRLYELSHGEIPAQSILFCFFLPVKVYTQLGLAHIKRGIKGSPSYVEPSFEFIIVILAARDVLLLDPTVFVWLP